MKRRYQIVLVILVAIFVYSSLFKLLMQIYEGKTLTFLDAVFWTVSTLTTLGEGFSYLQYRQPPLQLLSIFVQFSGIAIIYGIATLIVIPYLKENILLKLPEKAPKKLRDHIVICGYSEIVESFIDILAKFRIPFLIIEDRPEIARKVYDRGYPTLFGDLEAESTLENANARVAKLIIANSTDEKNANIALIARSFGKKIIVVTEDLTKAKFFKYAGASEVVSPKNLLGATMGRETSNYVLKSIFGVVEFFKDIKIASFKIEPKSKIAGKSIEEAGIRETGCIVVGIKKKDELKLNPSPDEIIEENSTIITIGEMKNLEELERLIHERCDIDRIWRCR